MSRRPKMPMRPRPAPGPMPVRPNPNVIPEFQAKTFVFGVDPLTDSNLTPAIDWLNSQILAGWQLFEFNKLYQEAQLLLVILMVRGAERKVMPVATAPGPIPTQHEPRG